MFKSHKATPLCTTDGNLVVGLCPPVVSAATLKVSQGYNEFSCSVGYALVCGDNYSGRQRPFARARFGIIPLF